MRKPALSLGALALSLLVLIAFLHVRSLPPAGAERPTAAVARSASAAAPSSEQAGRGIPTASTDRRSAGAAVPVQHSGNAVAGVEAGTNASATAPVSDAVWKQIQALQTAKAQRTPAQQKVDSQLLDAEKMLRSEPVAAGVPTLRIELDKDSEGRVLTDIDAKVSESLLQEISTLGGQVVNHFAQFDAIRARLPLAQVEALAARNDVKFIRPAVMARFVPSR